MKLLIDRSFEKDIKKVADKKIQNLVADFIEDIPLISKLSELSNCKKLKGSKNCYRIRIGDYRIGFIFEKNTIELIRFLHRSKIYNFFPD